MDKLIWISIFICLNSFRTYAQKDTLEIPYAVNYDNKIVTSISTENNANTFLLTDKYNKETTNIEFVPNIKQRLNLGVSYKLIDFSIGFTPKFMKNDLYKYKSKNINTNFQFSHKRWYQTFDFIYQKGFSINLDNVPQFYLPDLASTKIGGTTSYILNKNFSYKSLFSQNEWQNKSAGSFVPHFKFYYTNLALKTDSVHTHSEMYTLAIAPGYYYNWVINHKVILAGGISAGAGVIITNHDVSSIYESTIHLKLGYSTKSFFTYLKVNSTGFAQESKTEQLSDTFANAKFAIGYRFDPPKKVRNIYNNVTKEVGL